MASESIAHSAFGFMGYQKALSESSKYTTFFFNILSDFVFQVGDRVGLMRKSDGTLHFSINGMNVGKKINDVPILLYGVVDIFGRAGGVTITGMFEYNKFS